MKQVSICRTVTHLCKPKDVAYVLGSLEGRMRRTLAILTRLAARIEAPPASSAS